MARFIAMPVRLTDKPHAAGGRKVHALLGGGPGFDGKYVRGETWCGVHLRRPGLLLVETDAPVTCKTCIKAKKTRELAK